MCKSCGGEALGRWDDSYSTDRRLSERTLELRREVTNLREELQALKSELIIIRNLVTGLSQTVLLLQPNGHASLLGQQPQPAKVLDGLGLGL